MLLILAAPAIVLGAPLLVRDPRRARRMRVVISVLLGVLVLVGALSIGAFYLPAWASMVLAASVSQTPTPTDRTG